MTFASWASEQFRNAIRSVGLVPPDVIKPGRLGPKAGGPGAAGPRRRRAERAASWMERAAASMSALKEAQE
jgi:hypothetical protein